MSNTFTQRKDLDYLDIYRQGYNRGFQDATKLFKQYVPFKEHQKLQKNHNLSEEQIIKKYQKQNLQDPPFKQVFSQKKLGKKRKILQKHTNSIRIQCIEESFKKNPYLTVQQLVGSVRKIIATIDPNQNAKVTLKTMRVLTKDAGYEKISIKQKTVDINRELGWEFFLSLEDTDQIFFFNVDPMCIHPYMSKDLVYLKKGKQINQIITDEFRADYLNAIIIVGKNYIEWQLMQGIIKNDQYDKILQKIIQSMYEYVSDQKINEKNITLIVNPKYIESRSSNNKPFIQKQSEAKLEKLENLCKSNLKYKKQIQIKVIPPFSKQLDLTNILETYLKKINFHNIIQTKNSEIQDIRIQLKQIVEIQLKKLRNGNNQQMQKFWKKLQSSLMIIKSQKSHIN